MGCWTRTHCLQIFGYILASIISTNGQYEMLNLGKKLKTHELEYGTVLSSIETGPREQLNSKKAVNISSGVLLAFAKSDENPTPGTSENGEENATDPLFTTKCTTNRAILVNPSDLPTEDNSEVVTEDPNVTGTTDEPDEPTDDPKELTDEPTEPTEDPNDITYRDPTGTDPGPPITKPYDGPKKTHVPDHYLDDV